MAYPVKRPLLTAVIFLAGGIWCADRWPLSWKLCLLVAVILAAWGLLGDRQRLRGYGYLAAFCLGAALLSYASLPEEVIAPYLGEEAVLSGRIVSSGSEPYHVVLAVEEVNGAPLPHAGEALVTKPYNDETVYERGRRRASLSSFWERPTLAVLTPRRTGTALGSIIS